MSGEFEAQKQVADAIVLERAARVLERRFGPFPDDAHRAQAPLTADTVDDLLSTAARLRGEGEHQ